MDLLSIKIKICDRVYPMKVRSQDEAYVRKAGMLLEERIKHYKKCFNIQDQQDLLAMVAFDCLVEGLKIQKDCTFQTQEFVQQISSWKEHIEAVLKK